MSVKKITAYSLYCDGCQARYEGNDWTIWEDLGDMADSAIESEWSTDDTFWHCSSCPRLSLCECCGQPAGDYDGERDDYCQPCWDSAQGGDVCILDHPRRPDIQIVMVPR